MHTLMICYAWGVQTRSPRFVRPFSKVYESKFKILEQGESVSYLGRTISLDQYGYSWCADKKHVDILMEEWDMQTCGSAISPFWDDFGGKRPDTEQMSKEDATKFWRAAARINYLSQDRFDLAVASNICYLVICPALEKEKSFLLREL